MSMFTANWLPNIVTGLVYGITFLMIHLLVDAALDPNSAKARRLRELFAWGLGHRRTATDVSASTPLQVASGISVRLVAQRILRLAVVALLTYTAINLSHSLSGAGLGRWLVTGFAVYGLFLAAFLMIDRDAPRRHVEPS